jgi:hypothetical protein
VTATGTMSPLHGCDRLDMLFQIPIDVIERGAAATTVHAGAAER